MSIASLVTALSRLLLADVKKRLRDHLVATITQLVLAASLWSHGMWIQATTAPLHSVASVHVPKQTTSAEAPVSFVTCYPSGAADADEPMRHLVTAQRYRF